MPDPQANAIRTATLKSGITRITLHGVPHEFGLAAKFFKELGGENINVDDIIQSVSSAGKNVTMSFVVSAEQTEHARTATRAIIEKLGGAEIEITENLARLRVVGMGMRSHSGVAGKLFETVANEGINIENISTGEIVISILIAQADGERALRVVREAFGLTHELE